MPALAALTRFSNPAPPPSLVPDANMSNFGRMLLNSLYRCAEGPQALMEIGIAAVYRIHIVERGSALRRKHADEKKRRGAKRRRGLDVGRMKLRRALYLDAMRIYLLHRGTQLFHLHVVLRAAFVHPVVYQCFSFRLRRDRHEEREIVDVDAGIRARSDLLRRRA